MKNNEVKTWHILVFMLMVTTSIYMIYDKPEIAYDTIKTNCKEDSLQNVIDNLEMTLKSEEDGWDSKERRYDDIISEYEFMMSYLHDYHFDAYRDIHRVTGMKEQYSRETEKENKKRLSISKF